MSAPSPPNIYIRPKCLVDSIVLYWRQPVSSGGSDVNVYTITCASPLYSQTLPGNAYQHTITGLSAGTDYTFSITATNGTGTSPPATFRTVQVGLRPGGAQNVTASTSASTSAYVTWDFSTNTGEAPTNWFVLTAIPSTVGVAIIKQSAHGYERARNVFGLAPANSYQILVQAVSDVSYAPPTAISDPITTGTGGSNPPPPPPLTYWLPSVVTGLQAWYDGADPLGTGSYPASEAAVPTWYDKSGNSRNAVATGSPQFQTYSLNSLSGIAFVGNNLATIYYTAPIPAGTFSDATTLFVVYKSTQNNTNNALVTRGYGGLNSGTPDIYSNGIIVEKPGTGTSVVYLGEDVYNTSPSILQVTVDQYGNKVREWRNGSSISVSGGETETLSPGTADLLNNTLYIGTRGDLQTSFAGVFYEILAYNKVLSQSERQTIEGYLAWKWGLQASLPAEHAFKSAAPATNQTVVPRKSVLQLNARTYSGSGAWLDESGNGKNATIEAGAIAVNGAGNGIVLDGSTSLTLPNLALGTTWTVNVWYKDNGTTGQILPAIFTQIGASNMVIKYEGFTNVAWLAGDAVTTAPQFTLITGEWTNIQLTNDGSFMTLYINGVNSGVSPLIAPSVDGGTAYRIGGSYDDPAIYGYVTGEIGAINVYNYAAGQTQVQAEYSASLQNYGFNPTAIPGLQAWYDATDPLDTGAPVANGATVSTWADKSANNRDAIATGTPQVATKSQNLQSGIALSGNDSAPNNYYTAAIPTGTFAAATTFFVVYKSTANPNGFGTLMSRGVLGQEISNPDINSGGITVKNSGSPFGYNAYTTSAIYNPSPSIFAITVDQYGNNVSEWINGNPVNLLFQGGATLTPGTCDETFNSLFIGTRGSLATYFSGIFYEILVYNVPLSESERHVIEGYLGWKWGLQTTLPQSNPYYASPLPPTTITTVPRKEVLLLKATTYSGTGTWTDESGNQNDATLLTGTIAKNADGNGIILDGQTAWTFPNVDLPNEWSVNVWYKNVLGGAGAIVGQQTPGGANSNMTILLSENTFRGAFSDGGSYRVGSTIVFAPHAWTNIQVVWNGVNILTYVNGALVGSVAPGSATTQNAAQYYIGCNFSANSFATGEIGEVRIYNYAIGPLKVRQDYLESYSTFNFTNPLIISGCQLWLDSADQSSIVASGSTVTQWNDKSTNSNNATAVGTPKVNADIAGIAFDGSSYFTLPDGAIPYDDTSYTIYIVATISNSGDNSHLMSMGDDGSGGPATVIRASNSTDLYVQWAALGGGAFTPRSPFILTTKYITEGAASLFQNGTIASVNATPGVRTQTNTFNVLGSRSDGLAALRGVIYQVLVYNVAHTTEEQQLVEGYLAYRWSLQGLLPSTHQYYLAPPEKNPIMPFQPNKLAALQLWLDGKRINPLATTGNPVQTWIDYSYNGYNATQNTVENQPTSVAGGGIYFDSATANFLTLIQAAPLGSSKSCFFVTSGSSTNQAYLYATNNNYMELIFNYNETTPSISQLNVGQYAGDGDFITPGTALPQISLYNYTTINDISNIGYYMGTQVFNINPFYAFTSAAIGAIATGGVNYFDGTIYEMVCFNRALSTEERQKVEGYLAWKWGIEASLPVEHPYSSAAP